MAKVLAKEEEPLTAAAIAEKTNLSERKVSSALNRLKDVGAVEAVGGGEVELAPGTDLAASVQEAAAEQEFLKERNARRLEQMEEYCDISTCRRQYLLGYFGEQMDRPCGNCDNCTNSVKQASAGTTGGTRREVTA